MPPKPTPRRVFVSCPPGLIPDTARIPGAAQGFADVYVAEDLDAYALSYAAELRAENERLRGALREVVDVLGPDPATCTTNTCEGCQYEMRAAFTAARAALGEGQ